MRFGKKQVAADLEQFQQKSWEADRIIGVTEVTRSEKMKVIVTEHLFEKLIIKKQRNRMVAGFLKNESVIQQF